MSKKTLVLKDEFFCDNLHHFSSFCKILHDIPFNDLQSCNTFIRLLQDSFKILSLLQDLSRVVNK